MTVFYLLAFLIISLIRNFYSKKLFIKEYNNASLNKRHYQGILNNMRWYFRLWYSNVKLENYKLHIIHNSLSIAMITLFILYVVSGIKIGK
jgi:hypothetical protein